MKAFKFCLMPVVVLVLIFALVSSLAPEAWEARAETVIKATPALIHPHVEDLEDWENWAAWHRKDPELRSEYTGEPGAGMRSTWVDGDGIHGQNEVIASDVNSGVTMQTQMESFPPFRATIEYTPLGDTTRVVWESSSELPYGMRGLFWILGLDLGELVSEDYRDGLAGLKELVEAKAATANED
jgi:hypothetical protein